MNDDEDEIGMDQQDEVGDDEGISSDEGATNQARRARRERLDREMADLIKERDKFLATQDPFARKRVSRATRYYQYCDHDDGIYGGNRRGSSSKVGHQAPDRRYNDRHRRRRNIQTFPPVYDKSGVHINSSRDICDCLDIQCPGCHDECEACGSSKCGAECRSGRTWTHQEVIQFHPHKPKEIIRSRPV